MKNKFEVGQKYRVTGEWYREYDCVIEIIAVTPDYRFISYKNLTGGAYSGTTFMCNSPFANSLKLITPFKVGNKVPEQKIVITVSGNKTIANMYSDGKLANTVFAKCNPEDTFDFETGAKLALERLFEKALETLYNGKICVTAINNKDDAKMTVGKIYEVKNGLFHDDTNSTFPLFRNSIHNISELADYLRADNNHDKSRRHYSDAPVHFVEVVE